MTEVLLSTLLLSHSQGASGRLPGGARGYHALQGRRDTGPGAAGERWVHLVYIHLVYPGKTMGSGRE